MMSLPVAADGVRCVSGLQESSGHSDTRRFSCKAERLMHGSVVIDIVHHHCGFVKVRQQMHLVLKG